MGLSGGGVLVNIASAPKNFLKEMWPEEAKLIDDEMVAEINAEKALNPVPPKPKADAQAIAEDYAYNRAYEFWDSEVDNAKTRAFVNQAIAGYMIAELCRYEKSQSNKTPLITPLVNSNKMDELADKIQKSGIIDKSFDIEGFEKADNFLSLCTTGNKRHECLTAGLAYLQTHVKKDKTNGKSNIEKTKQNEKTEAHSNKKRSVKTPKKP